jgi:hypothetical protein
MVLGRAEILYKHRVGLLVLPPRRETYSRFGSSERTASSSSASYRLPRAALHTTDVRSRTGAKQREKLPSILFELAFSIAKFCRFPMASGSAARTMDVRSRTGCPRNVPVSLQSRQSSSCRLESCPMESGRAENTCEYTWGHSNSVNWLS